MAGALFNTMIQVHLFCLLQKVMKILNLFFFSFPKKKLGISFGITVTTIVFDKVALATPTGADMIVSYHYATWTSGGFGLIGNYFFIISFYLFSIWSYKFFMILAFVLGVLSFRGVGVVGYRESKASSVEEGTSASNSQPNVVTKMTKEDSDLTPADPFPQ